MALGSDGMGVVVDIGPNVSEHLMKQRVIVNPGQGWDSDLEGPESPKGYLTLGASPAGTGTMQQYLLADQADVMSCPEHLTDAEAAAIPAAGLTAWRALMVRSQNAHPGGISWSLALVVVLRYL